MAERPAPHRLPPAAWPTTPGRCAEHHRIRDEVFVGEQGLFARLATGTGTTTTRPRSRCSGSVDGVAGGAVRLYPLDGAGHWQGDRLAVLAGTRRHGLGAPLVRFAVATAAELGGRLMIAHIQPRQRPLLRAPGLARSGERRSTSACPTSRWRSTCDAAEPRRPVTPSASGRRAPPRRARRPARARPTRRPWPAARR